MAIHLEANYSKKLGLPGYSSHQYAVTIKTEVTDPAQVQAESVKLHSLLQACVDGEIQKVGYRAIHCAFRRVDPSQILGRFTLPIPEGSPVVSPGEASGASVVFPVSQLRQVRARQNHH